MPAAPTDAFLLIASRLVLLSGGAMDLHPHREEWARFFRAWIDRPRDMGAVTPSGAPLAALIAAEVDPAVEGPVIELGPGTGAVTDSLIARGISPSRLVLVESHPDFCALLEERYPEARIVSGDAYALDTCLTPLHLAPAAALISGLPMLSKPREARVALLRQAFLHLRPGAPFIQFTYAPTSPIPLTTPGVLARVSPRIWRNFPPAQVWTYREVPLLA